MTDLIFLPADYTGRAAATRYRVDMNAILDGRLVIPYPKGEMLVERVTARFELVHDTTWWLCGVNVHGRRIRKDGQPSKQANAWNGYNDLDHWDGPRLADMPSQIARWAAEVNPGRYTARFRRPRVWQEGAPEPEGDLRVFGKTSMTEYYPRPHGQEGVARNWCRAGGEDAGRSWATLLTLEGFVAEVLPKEVTGV